MRYQDYIKSWESLNLMSININKQTVYLNSLNNSYEIILNQVVKKEEDITAIILYDIPEYISGIRIQIGRIIVCDLDKTEIAEKNILNEYGLLTSKSTFQNTSLILDIDPSYLEQYEKSEYIDEYEEVYSDTEHDFHDGNIIRKGRRVFSKKTGNQIKKCHEDVPVIIPKISIDTKPGQITHEWVEIPFWEKIMINPNYERVRLQKMISNYGLHPVDGTDINEAINSNTPFLGKVKNILIYYQNMVGKKITF